MPTSALSARGRRSVKPDSPGLELPSPLEFVRVKLTEAKHTESLVEGSIVCEMILLNVCVRVVEWVNINYFFVLLS